MSYKYHIQYQAIERANTILPVPADYPLKPGVYAAFRADFTRLTELIKKIYLDISERPESYGLLLLPITEGKGLTDSFNSLRKPLYVLYALARSGVIENSALRVHIPVFKENVKQAKPGKLTQYNLIMDKLSELGFEFNGHNAKGFNKGQDHFTAGFPSDPAVIRALKTFADCCAEHQNSLYGEDADNPYKLFTLMDYKYTADLNKLPEITWVHDCVRFWEDEARAFYVAFYKQATVNPQIRWESTEYKGDFFKGKKHIARIKFADTMWKFNVVYITNPEYRDIMKNVDGYGNVVLSLHLYLPVKGKEDRFEKLPPHIIEYMKSKKCGDCDTFSGKKDRNDGKCPHTVYWTHNNGEQRGCSYHCFDFEKPKVEDVPAYCDML